MTVVVVDSESTSRSPSIVTGEIDTPATNYSADGGESLSKSAMTGVGGADEVTADVARDRLMFLIKQSGLYATIVQSKLEQQREDMKAESEKRRAAEAKRLRDEQSKETTAVDRTAAARRSSRGGPRLDEEKETKPARKTRGKPPKAKSGNIKSYFKTEVMEDLPANADVAAPTTETKLGAHDDLSSFRQPKLITGGVMKDYQLEGLDWMASLYENGFSGILADEMGLGKTLQTISLLAFLREKKVYGPFLIAAPVSTLSNWISEINKFAPGIPAVMYHGTPAEREELRRKYVNQSNLGENFPVVCTSYDLIMRDKKWLGRFRWRHLIIDEGHRIKNLNCKLIRELKAYSSENRLLLTGTPLQNNLAELWSLLNFLLPDLFDDLEIFQSWFDFSELKEKKGAGEWLDSNQEKHIINQLHAILKPFLLRRVKTDVEQNLPPKREYVLYAPLTQEQVDLYDRLLDGTCREWLIEKLLACREKTTGEAAPKSKKRKLLAAVESPSKKQKTEAAVQMGRGKRRRTTKYSTAVEIPDDEDNMSDDEFEERLRILHNPVEVAQTLSKEDRNLLAATKEVSSKKLQNLLMQLRLTCNSPHLFYYPWDPPNVPVDRTLTTASGKFLLLDTLVPELLKRGHKVLIFSQFVRMLDLLHDWADLHDWPICRLDGQMDQPTRQQQIETFNASPDHNIFLLSTRAGGLGINLTSSDTVILFDSDFNPQADLQAMDRAHRIGQTKPVIVYRLATASTVEQTILDKAEGKRRLEKLVIKKGKFRTAGVGDHEDLEEEGFANEVLREEAKRIKVLEEGETVIGEEELEILLDRSPEAYERAERGEGKGAVARVVMEDKGAMVEANQE